MFNEKNVPGPEYRIRPVVRYVVTRYCHPYMSEDRTQRSLGGSEVIAEFPSEDRALDVARAMAKHEEGFGATLSV
jgi:hypothetical protein